MTNKFIRDVKEVIRRLRNRGISFDGNRQYPAIPTIDNSVESHTNALRAIREAIETHERRNSKASLDSFVRLYELEDVLGGFEGGDTGAFGVDNVGTGAKVHKITESVGGVPTAKLRSLISTDGSITIVQETDQIDLRLPGGLTGPMDITNVGHINLTCGQSQTFYPQSSLPNLAVGDLMVWVVHIRPGVPVWTGWNNALAIPNGWMPYCTPKYYPNEDLFYYFAVIYKWADASDLSPSTYYTASAHNTGGYMCGRVMAFRGANENTPLSSMVVSQMSGPSQEFGAFLGHSVYGESQQQAVISAYSTMDTSPGGPTAYTYDWPIGPEADSPFDSKINYPGGSDYRMRMFHHVSSAYDDENWIPGENPTTTLSGAGWTSFGITPVVQITPYAYFHASSTGGSTRHYIEREVQLIAGQKYSFWSARIRWNWDYSNPDMRCGLSFIDPDGVERGIGIRDSYIESYLDPNADYNSTWKAVSIESNPSGVPNSAGCVAAIYFTAAQTGTYKIRLSGREYTTGNWTFTGTGSEEFKFSSVVFRSGWRTPTFTYTTNSAVYGGNAMRTQHVPGWLSVTGDNVRGPTYRGIAVVPAGFNVPIVGTGATQGFVDTRPYSTALKADNLEMYSGTFLGRNLESRVGPTRPAYPIYAGTRRKYYMEIKILEAGARMELVVAPIGAYSASFTYGPHLRWDASGNQITHTSGTITPATGSTFAINDIIGVGIDFTSTSQITVTLYKNGVVAATHSFACSTSSQFHPDEPWTVVYIGCTTTSIGYTQRAKMNYGGPFAYQPTGYSPWDIGYVAPPTNPITGVLVGSCAGSVPLVNETIDPEYPLIKALKPGSSNITITADPDGQCVVIDADIPPQSPTTTQGDLIRRGASADERLPIGVNGQVLTVVTGQPAWADPTGGGGGGSGTTFSTENGVVVCRRANAQTIPSNTAPAVTFDTEVRDDGGYADLGTASDRITITASGWYLLCATVDWDANSSGQRLIWMHKNGSSVISTDPYIGIANQPGNGTYGARLTISGIAYLAAGDYIQLKAYHDSGSDRTLPNNDGMPRMSVHRLGNQTLVNNTTPTPVDAGARVRRSTNQTITTGAGQAISFDTEERDDRNYWNSGSPTRFTIPENGWYVMTGAARWDANTSGARNLIIQKNGSTFLALDKHQATTVQFRHVISTIAYLNAGDYVELFAQQDSGGSLTLTAETGMPNFAIHRLGIAASPGNPISDGATVYKSTGSQTLSHDTATAVQFDTELVDNNGYANLGTNNDRLTVSQAGWYIVSGVVRFSGNTLGQRDAWIQVNAGTDRHGWNNSPAVPDAGSSTNRSVTAVLYLNAGDYVRLIAYQWHSTPQSLTISAAVGVPQLSIHRLGTPRMTKTPDTYQDSPNAMDDEFDGALLNPKWTLNSTIGSATAPTGMVLRQGALILPSGGSGSNFAFGQAISGNFKVRCKVAMFTSAGPTASYAQYQQAGIYAYRSATTKWISLHLLNDLNLQWSRLTAGAFNSSYVDTSFGGSLDRWQRGMYFELEYDGTNLIGRCSLTGHEGTFYTVTSETVASHLGGAPDQVGIRFNRAGGTDMTAIFDWFRRIS